MYICATHYIVLSHFRIGDLMTKWERNLKNLTAWVRPDLFNQWNEQRLLESNDSNKPIAWSEWMQTKINIGINVKQVPNNNEEEDSHHIKALLHHRNNEIEKLNKRIHELERREMGVSDDRVLRILSQNKFIVFDDIVQKLIDTEAENAYNTLNKLAVSGIIKSDNTGNSWRIKK